MKIKKIEKDRNRKNIIKMLMLTVIFLFGIFVKSKAEDDGLPKLQGDEKIVLSNEYKPAELRLEVTKLKSKELKGHIDEGSKKIKIMILDEYSSIKNEILEIYDQENHEGKLEKKRIDSRLSFEKKGSYIEITYSKKPEKLYIVGRDSKGEVINVYNVKSFEQVQALINAVTIYMAGSTEPSSEQKCSLDLGRSAVTSTTQTICSVSEFTKAFTKSEFIVLHSQNTETITGSNSVGQHTLTLPSITLSLRTNGENLLLDVKPTFPQTTYPSYGQQRVYLYSSKKQNDDTLISNIAIGYIDFIFGTNTVSILSVKNMDFGEIIMGQDKNTPDIPGEIVIMQDKTQNLTVQFTDVSGMQNIYTLQENGSSSGTQKFNLFQGTEQLLVSEFMAVVAPPVGTGPITKKISLTGKILGTSSIGKALGNYQTQLNVIVTLSPTSQGGQF